MAVVDTDICVIGAGTGGLNVAAGAAQLGRNVVLVEKGEMGGESLNTGCVPSKALIAAARSAFAQTNGSGFGVTPVQPRVDGARVMAHVREAISSIAPHESQERVESLGVRVIRAAARFLDDKTVEAGNQRVGARRFVIATGSRPVIPDLPGLSDVPYLTSETIFAMQTLPERLIVIGGGAVGLELAQAYRRLGAEVTVIDSARMLAGHERSFAQPVFDALAREGVRLREGAKINAIKRIDGGVRVQIARVQGPETIEGSHLLVAAGRVPDIETLDLAKAGVASDVQGITVDSRLRSSNKRVYAIGDAAGAPQSAHVASYHANLVIRNLVSWRAAHSSYDAAPEVLYTDPELAHVGLRQADAEERKLRFDVISIALDETDRGRTDRLGESVAKVIVGKKGRILGASIVGPSAGDHILPWVLAISQDIRLSEIAKLIVPYPTLGDHLKRVAAAYYAPTLFGRKSRYLSGALAGLR